MTTIRNDYIRQASIFTMGGLIDPRFEHEHNLVTVQPKKHKGKGSLKFLFKAWKAVAIFFGGKPIDKIGVFILIQRLMNYV